MKKILSLLIGIPMLVSCASDGWPEDGKKATTDAIYVAPMTRTTADGIDTDHEDLIIIDAFDENSILYFSQLGTTQNPNFNPAGDFNAGNPYCYQYQYAPNDEANWEQGFNFQKKAGSEAFAWSSVPAIGSVGNAFSFYAMYFPVDNTVTWSIKEDQSDINNFKRSDIMGAYHATSSTYTRMRFRLFHLMVYLHIKLYVPIYRDEVDKENYSYSGFDKGAVQGAYVMNSNTSISIEWRANRTSDTMAPLAAPSGNKNNIKVYSHPSDEKEIELKVGDYYDKGNLETDMVREYQFSVLFPSQEFGDNFLCFALRDRDNALRYFYFSGNQVLGDGNNFSLSQGTLQQLSLYLPRYTNETILIGANILPWNSAVTDMTVSKDEAQTDKQ